MGKVYNGQPRPWAKSTMVNLANWRGRLRRSQNQQPNLILKRFSSSFQIHSLFPFCNLLQLVNAIDWLYSDLGLKSIMNRLYSNRKKPLQFNKTKFFDHSHIVVPLFKPSRFQYMFSITEYNLLLKVSTTMIVC